MLAARTRSTHERADALNRSFYGSQSEAAPHTAKKERRKKTVQGSFQPQSLRSVERPTVCHAAKAKSPQELLQFFSVFFFGCTAGIAPTPAPTETEPCPRCGNKLRCFPPVGSPPLSVMNKLVREARTAAGARPVHYTSRASSHRKLSSHS